MDLPIESYDKLFINGEYVAAKSTKTLELRNPTENSLVTNKVPVAGEKDVDIAVSYAEEAFNGPWSQFSASQRSACLRKLADLLETKTEPILKLDSLSVGHPVSLTPKRENGYIKACLLYYAGWTDKQRGDYFPADDGFVKLVRHEPLGVCAAINPYNAPVSTFILKAAPCLATGNVLIVKPSEKSPLGSLAIAALFEEAGFPKGVVQVLSGDGSTGALLASHMRVRKVSFTGSIGTGRKIQEMAARSNLKRVTLELGGKSPAIVFDDANIENALTWTINGILTRSGQVCVAASRLYVQDTIADGFIKTYVEKMKAATSEMGDPLDPSVSMGPLADSLAFEKVKAMIARGREEAELVVGGAQVGEDGFFMQPTVFLNPKPDAQVLTEEVFGPVAVVQTFKTEGEVIKLANDTEYGLMAGVFTKDINRALRVSSRVESGVVGINCISVMNLQVPFGGKKGSGIGREFGEYALRCFTEPKTVLINMNA
ncbi:aldehyde dehydrogenase [Colletotrichum scovillei]|uniref:aldehyde dehydrogenase (NAD(+)) n=1 Tax=Colletotrichum scovillei TaxID=1209932 RepID=A0A9P7R8Y2_9PEZI|nr:aldehyde dehydrogenase [Colletotrichum scovillei]KAG7070108.1 aldehyde dehydrogenase [Colletotrichum scovillei]KAG7078357.1 aldehyde dehydrogenase [Colletotrichum scovillei]